MKISLRKKVSLSFLAAIIGSIIIVSSISNYMINKRFNKYLVDEQEAKVTKITKIVENLYDEKNSFSAISKDEISRYAVLEEIYIEVRDSSGKVVFTSGNSHLQDKKNMEFMMGHMMKGFSGMNLGEYKEETFPIIKDNKNIGTIVVGYFGISYLTQGALTFKATLNQSLVMSAFIALVFGLSIGFILSKQLVLPLFKITRTANEMRNGNLAVRASVNTNTKEIEELSASINYLAETLQNQEMLRKRLTSDMAHEIRTPLTTLKTHVEAMLDGIWQPTKERLQGFYEEIERLSKLVENLRDLAKLEQATLNLSKSKFDIGIELKKIILTFEPLYIKSNYKIYSDIEDNILVYMDKDKLKQIMHNLISNAYKYLEGEGEVYILLKRDMDKIIIKVKDNGIGISEKDIPYIFERFYRTDLSRHKNTGGSGIGLTITKTLVEAHGGNIKVESKLGEGSTFIIKFPTSIILKEGSIR